MRQYAEAVGFNGAAGTYCFCLQMMDRLQVLYLAWPRDDPCYGALARDLPDGDWFIDDLKLGAVISLTAMVLGAYQFDRYKKPNHAMSA